MVTCNTLAQRLAQRNLDKRNEGDRRTEDPSTISNSNDTRHQQTVGKAIDGPLGAEETEVRGQEVANLGQQPLRTMKS